MNFTKTPQRVYVATRDEHASGNLIRSRPITMRRVQTVRNYANGKSSLQPGADDLGALTEGDERPEDRLRKKLLEKDRENDKVCVCFFLGFRVSLSCALCSCVRRFRRCRFNSPSGRLWKPYRSCRGSTRTWNCSCKELNERTRDAWLNSSGETLTEEGGRVIPGY